MIPVPPDLASVMSENGSSSSTENTPIIQCTFSLCQRMLFTLSVSMATASPHRHYQAGGIVRSVSSINADESLPLPHSKIKLLCPKILFLVIVMVILITGVMGLFFPSYHNTKADYHSNRYCLHESIIHGSNTYGNNTYGNNTYGNNTYGHNTSRSSC